MRTPELDAALKAVRQAANLARLAGASPSACAWEATFGALGGGRSWPTAEQRVVADAASAAVTASTPSPQAHP